ncbi:histone deacetylase family protein [Chitinilyticum litopenaei]|uniref:Histone deacetylase family protein n=1 Tax=Chitinilyticum piscinae TaxID=2866724 RepID=A0A8J7K216_9NEIS|nr:histone deacetylase family protein [Chitinilyticum piscinae]MBE9609412.1 histone deacetylase family protein [Chitinilyticum piscinae]
MHDMGKGHPECPARLAAIQDRLIAAGLWDYLLHVDAEPATRAQVERVHLAPYLDELAQRSPAVGTVQLDPDTAINAYTLRAAYHAAGAGIRAADLVMQGKAQNAFCAIRPPGHHAERDKSMGFCFFNNVAVAAYHLIAEYGLQRIAIIDFDVHHGNGTEDICAGDERILMVSIFQHPFYPYSGDQPKGSNMLNVPMARAATGQDFREVVSERWLPALRAFAPEFILISAGFDAHLEDDMGSLGLVEADYAWVTRQLMKIAAEFSSHRIVSLLEGGYDLSALGRSVAEHVRVLTGE